MLDRYTLVTAANHRTRSGKVQISHVHYSDLSRCLMYNRALITFHFVTNIIALYICYYISYNLFNIYFSPKLLVTKVIYHKVILQHKSVGLAVVTADERWERITYGPSSANSEGEVVVFEQEKMTEAEVASLELQMLTEEPVSFEQNKMPELEAAAVAQLNKGHRHRFHFRHPVLFKSHQLHHQHFLFKATGTAIVILLVVIFQYRPHYFSSSHHL